MGGHGGCCEQAARRHGLHGWCVDRLHGATNNTPNAQHAAGRRPSGSCCCCCCVCGGREWLACSFAHGMRAVVPCTVTARNCNPDTPACPCLPACVRAACVRGPGRTCLAHAVCWCMMHALRADEERNLFSIAFKHVVGSRRAALRIVNALIAKHDRSRASGAEHEPRWMVRGARDTA